MIIGFDAKRAFHNTSGLGNYSRDIIRILSRYYPQNKYLLYNPKLPRVNRLILQDNMLVKYPISPFWKKFSSVWRQGPVVKQVKADGVQIFHGLSNEIPRGLHRKNIRSVVTIHDLIFLRYPELFGTIDRKIYEYKFRQAAREADVVLAISEQTKQDVVEFFEVPEQRVQVHYQGCHHAFKQTYASEEKDDLRRRWALPERFVLTVGTVERRKNALVLLKALKDTEYDIVLIGKPTAYKKELDAYIASHRMEKRVHFIRGLRMDELAAIYQMATVFCYPSIFEGFGIPIIEALYSGVPVITSAGGCFPEAGGPTSRYVDSLDEAEWQRVIKNLMENEEMRKRMAAEGLEYVQKFNDDRVAERLFRIYLNLEK